MPAQMGTLIRRVAQTWSHDTDGTVKAHSSLFSSSGPENTIFWFREPKENEWKEEKVKIRKEEYEDHMTNHTHFLKQGHGHGHVNLQTKLNAAEYQTVIQFVQ
jgi:ABC-type nickel/cobalt efflux system permease component RcnA